VVTGVKGTVAEKRSGLKKLIFPGCVLMIYGIVFVINPAGAAMAFRSSTAILLQPHDTVRLGFHAHGFYESIFKTDAYRQIPR
jgi:hypothetical protein